MYTGNAVYKGVRESNSRAATYGDIAVRGQHVTIPQGSEKYLWNEA